MRWNIFVRRDIRLPSVRLAVHQGGWSHKKILKWACKEFQVHSSRVRIEREI